MRRHSPNRQEAERAADRGGEQGSPRQRRQSDGCAAPEPSLRRDCQAGQGAADSQDTPCEESGREEAQGKLRGSRLVPVMERPQKITFAEMRESGAADLLR